MGPAVRVGDAGAPAAVSGGVVRRPGLFQRLDGAARVVEVSAPAGSGKTVLLRSWVGESGLADRAGWVPVRRGEGDPRWFWVSVADALRGTVPGSALVRPVTAAPDLDGWAIVEWLLKDLAALEDRIWLVIDDVHELRSADVQRQLELLVMRAPRELRFVLATRHDLGLGLHRLRLEGELTEIRAADLRFSLEEARANQQLLCCSTTFAGHSNSRAVITPTRWPLSGQPEGKPNFSFRRTRSRRKCGRSWCIPCCARVRPRPPSRPWPRWTSSSVKPGR